MKIVNKERKKKSSQREEHKSDGNMTAESWEQFLFIYLFTYLEESLSGSAVCSTSHDIYSIYRENPNTTGTSDRTIVEIEGAQSYFNFLSG